MTPINLSIPTLMPIKAIQVGITETEEAVVIIREDMNMVDTETMGMIGREMTEREKNIQTMMILKLMSVKIILKGRQSPMTIYFDK